MLDLSPFTFVPEFTREARYNGVPLEHGAVLSIRQEGGRAIGDFSHERGGSGHALSGRSDHATAYVRDCEPAFGVAAPKLRDTLTVFDNCDQTDYSVIGILERRSGAYKLLVEKRNSRRINTGK